MAIGTYAQLQTAVANWLHRADLNSQILDFIALAESRINRKLSIRGQELTAPLVTVIGSRFITLPSDFGSPIDCWLTTYQPQLELFARTPETLPIDDLTQAQPRYWAIDGANLAFERRADQAYSIALRYSRSFKLSDVAPTNQMLTDYPDVYLYGTLLEAAPYTRDNAQIAVWQDRFNTAVREVAANDNKNKSLAPLITEVSQLTRGRRYDINVDY